MKSLSLSTILIVLLFSCNGLYAQTGKPEVKKDTTSVQLTNDTPLLTINDYQEFYKDIVQEMPAKYADVIKDWIVKRFNLRIEEAKKKKPN